MKTKLMAVVCLASFCVAQAGSVLDGMQHCVRSLGDLNANGQVDANEVIDVLTYSAAAQNGNDAPAVCGQGAQISHIDVEYAKSVPPGEVIASKGLYFPQPATTDPDGNVSAVVQTIRFANIANSGNTNTVHVRFRWDGPVQTNFESNCSVMRYGYQKDSNGYEMNIRSVKGSWTRGYVNFTVLWGVINTSNLPITAGQWYDIFIARPRRKANGGGLDASCDFTVTLFKAGETDATGQKTEVVAKYTGAGTHAYVGSRHDVVFGGYETVSEPTAITSGADMAARSFRGVIDRYETWNNKMLTEAEMREVVADYHGGIAMIGAKNGAADEFSDDDAAEVYDFSTMPWSRFRKTLTAAHPSVSFKVNLGANCFVTNLSQVVAVNALFDADAPAKCPVELRINGRLAQLGDLREASGRALFVGGKYMKPDANGCATFTLTRTGDLSGTVSLDSVAVCGGGSIGRADGNWDEFTNIDYCSHSYFFGDLNSKHVGRSHNAAYYNTMPESYFFYVPADSIGRETYSWKMGFANLALDTGDTIDFLVNGHVVGTVTQYAKYSKHSFDIPAEYLVPGMNTRSHEQLQERSSIKPVTTGYSRIAVESKDQIQLLRILLISSGLIHSVPCPVRNHISCSHNIRRHSGPLPGTQFLLHHHLRHGSKTLALLSLVAGEHNQRILQKLLVPVRYIDEIDCNRMTLDHIGGERDEVFIPFIEIQLLKLPVKICAVHGESTGVPLLAVIQKKANMDSSNAVHHAPPEAYQLHEGIIAHTNRMR